MKGKVGALGGSCKGFSSFSLKLTRVLTTSVDLIVELINGLDLLCEKITGRHICVTGPFLLITYSTEILLFSK